MTSKNCPPSLQTASRAVGQYLSELQELSSTNLLAMSITLEALLGAGTDTKSADYRVPPNSDICITQIQSYWRSTNIPAEVTPNAIFAALSMEDLAEVRLGNCLVELKLKDRKLEVSENGSLCLAPIRRSPIYFPKEAPLLIPPGVTLQANFSLQSVVAAVAGQDAYYGLILSGFAIPRRD